jgi:predicted secreted protein
LNAGTAQFIQEMDKANAKVRDFGKGAHGTGESFRQMGAHTVSGTMAASGAIRVMEGNVQNNIRAVERFLSTTLKLGPVLQAAFPVVGAIAFAGLIAKLGEEAVKFFKELQASPEKAKGAFAELNATLNITNDTLRVSNDHLDNEIAKLQGKPQNNLKLALDEARLAADNLAKSLESDIQAFYKLLKEQEVGTVSLKHLAGQASDADLTKLIGGESGFGGLSARIAQITDEGTKKIAALKDEKAQHAARVEMDTRLNKEYANSISAVNDKIGQTQKLLDQHKGRTVGDVVVQWKPDSLIPSGLSVAEDARAKMEKLVALRRALQAQQVFIPLQEENTDKTAKKTKLTVANENAKVGQPFQNEMAKLEAAYKGAVEKLNAAGLSEGGKALAKAHAEAFVAIAKVNTALKDQHQALLTLNQQEQIRSVLTKTVTTEAEATWRESLAKSTAETNARIQSQELLTAAIGKGYAAVKAARVETQLAQEAPEKYFDPQFRKTHAADFDAGRVRLGKLDDAINVDQITKATDALHDQIELEKSLAAVQSAGAEAIERVTLAYRLREIVMRGGLAATKEQIKAEMQLFDERRVAQSEKDLTGLNLEISGLQRLSAAQIHGAEAARQAALANEAARLKFEGKSDAVVGGFLQKAELEHQAAILDNVLKTANATRDRIAKLAEEEAAARSLQDTQADQLGLAIKLKEIDQERVAILSEQALVFGNARDGMKQFFAEMATESISAARMVHDTLGNAFNSLNDTLVKVMTGQKVSWSNFFRQIGEDMSKLAVHQLEVEAVKKIGAIITARQQSHVGQKKGPMDKVMDAVSVALGGAGAVKRDGNTEASALYVTLSTASRSAASLTGKPDGTAINPFYVIVEGQQGQQQQKGQSVLGTIAGALMGLAGAAGAAKGGGASSSGESVSSSITFDSVGTPQKFGGYKAIGGGVDPGYSYVVGERGPEVFTPGSRGAIIPNSGGRGSGNVYYNIDARNSDPVATEQRVRAALAATHKSAVMTSMRAMTEQSRRTPRHA